MNAMRLSRLEQETIINFNEAEANAEVYTYNAALQRRLLELCAERPEQARKTGMSGGGALTFTIPKKWVKVVPPRVLSPAQRAVIARMNEKRRCRNPN